MTPIFLCFFLQCSIECGSGTQQREVICVRKNADTFEVLDPYECSFLERPPSQQSCHLKPCGAKWFNTEWSMVSPGAFGRGCVSTSLCFPPPPSLLGHLLGTRHWAQPLSRFPAAISSTWSQPGRPRLSLLGGEWGP